MHDHEGHWIDIRMIRGVDPTGDPGEEGGEAESEDPIVYYRHSDRFRQVLRIPYADDGFPHPGPVDLNIPYNSFIERMINMVTTKKTSTR